MPHVSIKHFPVSVGEEQQEALVAAVTKAVTDALGCAEDVVSIALEAVPADQWNDIVYEPEIVTRKEFLIKSPSY
jgi:4-oxalocrotonate tautomerase